MKTTKLLRLYFKAIKQGNFDLKELYLFYITKVYGSTPNKLMEEL